MVAVVTRMSTIKWNDAAQLCSEALVTVFENDESGRSSLDAVKMIIRMVKSKGFAISENAINVFLHLRLKDEMAHNYAKDNNNDDQVGKKRKNNNKPFMTKKARKTQKETREIEKEFQEAEAVVSKEEKEKNVNLLLDIYLKILMLIRYSFNSTLKLSN
jgi:nucleolar complex protein 3